MKKSTLILVSIISIAMLSFGLWMYIASYNNDSQTYSQGTTINGVDCSGMSKDQASVALSKSRNAQKVTVTQNGKTLTTIGNLNLTFDTDSVVDETLHGYVTRLYLPITEKNVKTKEVDMKVITLPAVSKKELTSYSFLDNDYTTLTKDAYVDLSDTDFNIVKEVYGDNVDKGKFVTAILKCYETGETNLEYNEEDYYASPKVKSDSQELKDYQENCKKYLSIKVTYQFYNGNYVIPPSDLATMIKFDDNGMTVDEDAVENYVTNLAYARNTVGTTRSFKTASGSTISVSGGNYGYALDIDAETKKLKEDLEDQKDVTREPEYSSKAYVSGSSEIGNSYVEINLSAQTAYLYKNGSRVLSTPIVTGNVSKDEGTPTGVYRISYLDSGATLKGLNYDGTKYASKVSYWMPFNGDIGLHDAPWRKTFGGKYYLTEGSHGCVNLPKSAAATFFSNVEAGFPVIVY